MHDVVARMGEDCHASRTGKSAIFINQHLKNLVRLHDLLTKIGAVCPAAAEQSEEKVKTAALRRVLSEPNFVR